MSGIVGVDRLLDASRRLPPAVELALRQELRDALNQPVAQFRRNVKATALEAFPSGYGPTYAGSFRLKQDLSVGAGLVAVKLRGTARGKASIRDSAALNRGVLRHKTFGRLPWHSQAVAPGFWDRPAERLIADLRAEVRRALAKVAAKVEADL